MLRGNLVGTRDGDTLAFRCTHLDRHRETATGRCRTEVSVDAVGLVRLAETWHWEPKAGSGTSTLVERR